MKKIIALLSGVMIMLSAVSFSFSAYAAEPEQMGTSSAYYTYDRKSKTLTIKGDGATPDYPNWNNTPWFEYLDDIEHLIVEEGITRIGNYTFYNFVSCKDVLLPSTLTEIGKNAFSYGAFQEIVLPEALIVIDYRAFDHCSLKYIKIPAAVEQIGKQSFQFSQNLSAVEFDSFCKCEVLDSAFMNCENLNSISVPSQVSLGKQCVGFDRFSKTVDGFTIYGYQNTSARSYAVVNGINFVDLETYTIELAVGKTVNSEIYSEGSVKHFTFTPSATAEYKFFSTGTTDVRVTLYDSENGRTAEHDDISDFNRNFCLNYNCTAGKTYSLDVEGVGVSGAFRICAMPVNIVSVSASFSPELNFVEYVDASEKDGKIYYDYSKKLSFLKLNIVYDTGYEAVTTAADGEFSYIDIIVSDNQLSAPWRVGRENYVTVSYGDFNCTAPVTLSAHSHEYETTVVEPTLSEGGYTIYTCKWCSKSYNADFTERLGREISGKAVLLENPQGSCEHSIPVSGVEVYADGEHVFTTGDDGSYSFITEREGCDITFVPPYGPKRTIHVDEGGDIVLEKTALAGFDFNNDSHINIRDLSKLLRMAKESGGIIVDYNGDGVTDADDFKLANNFLYLEKTDESVYENTY